MLKAFNSLQIVAMYAASPFVIGWLFSGATFPYAHVLAWASVLGYGIFSWLMVAAVYLALEKDW